tara:strand:+ start:161 stop:916 length:756 start_codon:yes stop_codon:yes gene_type:complete
MTDPDPTEEIIQPFSTLTTSEQPTQPETDLGPLTDSLRKLLTEKDKPSPPPPPFFPVPLPPPPISDTQRTSFFMPISHETTTTFQKPGYSQTLELRKPIPRRVGRDFRRRSPSPSRSRTGRDRSRSRDENREEYGLQDAKPSISPLIKREDLRNQLSMLPIHGGTDGGGTQPPQGSPIPSGSSSPVWFFGKVMKPYKKHIHSINKDGVLFKTRFGIKKLRNDNKGLYLRQNGKNYYLYTWGEKQQSLLTYK